MEPLDPESRFAGEPWFDSELAALAEEEAAEQHRPSSITVTPDPAVRHVVLAAADLECKVPGCPACADPTSIEELIERSSLGTPAARRLRASVPDDVAQRIAQRAEALRIADAAEQGPYGVRFHGLAAGGETPFDGMWLAEYDPGRPGVAPDGRPMLAHITATDDPAKAMRLPSLAAFHELWTATSGRTRPDGRPDRPLTAFNVEYVRLPA
jgi:hypothetical protein